MTAVSKTKIGLCSVLLVFAQAASAALLGDYLDGLEARRRGTRVA